MKLELKHLSPYLPYDLNLIFEKSGRIIQMQSCFNNGSLQITDQNEGNTYDLSIWNFKPILRPLSQLDDLMPNSGSSYTSFLWYDIIGTDCDNFDKDLFFENCSLGLVSHLPIMCYNQLLKCHFDVNNLIKNNLAIPKL